MRIQAGVRFLFVKVPICKGAYTFVATHNTITRKGSSIIHYHNLMISRHRKHVWVYYRFQAMPNLFCSLIPDKKNSLNIRYSNSSFFFHDFQNLFSSFNREQHCLLLHSKPHPFNFKNQRYKRFRIPLYTVSYRLSRECKEIFGYYCNAKLSPRIFEANLLTKSTSRGIILAVWISFWIPDICR